MLDADQHPAAVDGGRLEPGDLPGAQPRPVGRGQRRPVAQAGNRFEELHDLVGAEHNRQPLRLAGCDDALDRVGPAQRDAVEEPQGAHGLIDVRPRALLADQMQLVGAHLVKAQLGGRAPKIPAELGDGIELGLLRRRREIADHHVVDHSPTQRAGLSHRKLLSVRWVVQPQPLRQETATSAVIYREAVSFNPHSVLYSHDRPQSPRQRLVAIGIPGSGRSRVGPPPPAPGHCSPETPRPQLPERRVMHTATVANDLDPLQQQRLTFCGCHSGSLIIASRHVAKQNTPRSTQQGGFPRRDTFFPSICLSCRSLRQTSGRASSSTAPTLIA